MDVQPFIAWLAPIASTLAVAAGQLALNSRFKAADEKRDEARAEAERRRSEEALWRSEVASKLTDIDEKVNRSVAVQASQLRSDIIHKSHRYLDDLGRASTEEKQALSEEHRQYSQFCEDLGFENNFIDQLVARVMALPEREV